MTQYGLATQDMTEYADAHKYKHLYDNDELGIANAYEALSAKEAVLPEESQRNADNLSATVMTISGINADVQYIINHACTANDYGFDFGNTIIGDQNKGKYVTEVYSYAFCYDYNLPNEIWLQKCTSIGEGAFEYSDMWGAVLHLESMDGSYIEENISNWLGYHWNERTLTVHGKDGYVHEFTFEAQEDW